jgi:hypothetical protein
MVPAGFGEGHWFVGIGCFYAGGIYTRDSGGWVVGVLA